MNKRHRKIRHQQRQQHGEVQSARLKTALKAATQKAKQQRKGKKFIQNEMEKAGYLPNGKGGWRAKTKLEQSNV